MDGLISLTRFKEGSWPTNATYRKTQIKIPPGFSAVISCPHCGVVGSLDESHDIHANGEVYPSVVCHCGFHDFIILEGYDG